MKNVQEQKVFTKMKEQRTDQEHGGDDVHSDEPKDRKHKKRCKKTIAQLKEQIEFYFCDANLLKDRFMKKVISSHPEGYIKIDTIASFNRLKQLTDDRSLIVKAMKLSPLLEVSTDDTAVRRISPLPQPRNVDAETIYVERLPPYADIEWIKSIFSQYGKVQYVSLPRFKNTRDIKGFAFVEFETKEQALTALQSFSKGNRPKKEPETSEAPEHCNEQFVEQSKLKSRTKRSHSESEVDSTKLENTKPEWKRKRTTSESSSSSLEHSQPTELLEQTLEDIKENKEFVTTDGEAKTKKRKKSVRWEEEIEEKGSLDSRCTEAAESLLYAGSKRGRSEQDHEQETRPSMECKRAKRFEADSNAESGGEENEAKNKKYTKKRKRKKKDKKEVRHPHLRVLSKFDWLRLKAEYKELQRKSIQNLKAQLQQSQTNDRGTQGENEEAVEVKTLVREEEKPPIAKLPYTPGVVLKFESRSGELIVRDVRESFTRVAPVAYLDLQEGRKQGFVRFHTAGRCEEFLEKFSSEELKIETLNDDEERQYWEKINADRMARYKAKREKKRGSEKVVKKVEAFQKKRNQHFYFDDNDT